LGRFGVQARWRGVETPARALGEKKQLYWLHSSQEDHRSDQEVSKIKVLLAIKEVL
jgi:hypothetical protein